MEPHDKFSAHGWCFLWNPELISLHVASDALIAIAYTVISVTLLVIRSRTSATAMVPRWIFRSFATFIFACGCTHVMDIITIFSPLYFLQGFIKLVAAAASISTAGIVVLLAYDTMHVKKVVE